MRFKPIALALCLAVAAQGTAAVSKVVAGARMWSAVEASSLAAKKRTRLGLHVTAKEAYAALTSRAGIYLIDVRTRAEVMFVGFPTVAAANIPFMTLDPRYPFDAKKRRYKMIPNADFIAAVGRFLAAKGVDKGATLMLMCRSGGRAAKAVDALAKNGYTNVYSVVDSFEGDADKTGKRTVNGWKNAGNPWTYRLSPDIVYRAAAD